MSVYTLAISQLIDDGYSGAAQAVSSATGTPGSHSLPHRPLASILAGNAIPDSLRTKREGFVAKHALPVGARACARWSGDGRTIAAGTGDGAVGLFDAESLLKGGVAKTAQAEAAPTAVIRRYADHKAGVNDVDFHPGGAIVVSASEDATLHFYDTASAHTGPARTCTDTHPARSAAFHPHGGEHLLVGTSHAALHLYDMASFRCYLASNASHHHRAAITDARWSADGAMVASCAAGEVKLWDGHNMSCVATLGRPHGGTPVGSVAFSKSGRQLLTSGADSALKLWDVRALREAASEAGGAAPVPLRTYEGGGQGTARRVGCFSHDDRHVIGADETTASAIVWLSSMRAADVPVGGEVVAKCAGHAQPIRCIAHSPTAAAFVTCAEDGTLRAWAEA